MGSRRNNRRQTVRVHQTVGRWGRGLPQGLAVLGGVAIAVIGVRALDLGQGGQGEHPGPLAPARVTVIAGAAGPRARERTPSKKPQPQTGHEAVRVATSDLLALNQAGFGTSADARRTVDVIATGPLRQRLAGALPFVGARIHARVNQAGAPATFDTWPLGYQLLLVTATRAVVRVWHLDVAATSALGLAGAEYQTTTFRLTRSRGAWMIYAAATSPGPTPPPASASAAELNAFAVAANSFTGYRDVP